MIASFKARGGGLMGCRAGHENLFNSLIKKGQIAAMQNHWLKV
jgi:hypothetical protein